MNAQSIVAIILTFGLVLILLTGTPLRFLWMDDAALALPPATAELTAVWRDVLLVIVGALTGFISGRSGGDGGNKQ